MLVILLGCTALFTLGGYLLKAQCIGHYNEYRDARLCSNDLQMLYVARGMIDRPFPYVNGDLVDHKLVGGALEYPVLTGVIAWLPALLVQDEGSYLQMTALLLMPFTFVSVWLLGRMVRWRALIYALAPPLVWYSFHNYDLPLVASTIAAFYCWWRGRYGWAGAFLAVGGLLKFWPVLFILPLLLDRLAAQDRKGAGRALAWFSAVFGVVNGAFLLASPQGWWAPYAFQGERSADVTSNSIWFWGWDILRLTTHDLNVIVPVLVLMGTGIACALGWLRAKAEGEYPFIQVCAAVLCVFLLTNKAHSPQYALWLLPFFCLLRLRWGWWVTYLSLDAVLYVGLFRWFHELRTGTESALELAKQATIIGVWGRAVMLVLLFFVVLRVKTALEPAAGLLEDELEELVQAQPAHSTQPAQAETERA